MTPIADTALLVVHRDRIGRQQTRSLSQAEEFGPRSEGILAARAQQELTFGSRAEALLTLT
jgi:hypothetical protein